MGITLLNDDEIDSTVSENTLYVNETGQRLYVGELIVNETIILDGTIGVL